jgi:peptide-methionine (S)-S-oxide reductase
MRNTLLIFAFLGLTFTACDAQKDKTTGKDTDVQRISDYISDKDYSAYEEATLAGGCFWCTEASFERIEGVVDVISGYSGGEKPYPTYYQVAGGNTKYAEAIQIYYDPEVISYEEILDIFFVAHDPTTLNRQGPDVGPQYRSAIFYRNEQELATAKKVIERVNENGMYRNEVVTQLTPYEEFWTAEGYHQDYYEHNPGNTYIQRVSKPKVEKVMKTFKDKLKPNYAKKVNP